MRGASRRWPPKFGSLAEAYAGIYTNSKSGRQAKHYRCAICDNLYPSSMVQVDHINPIIDPQVGFQGWDKYIDALFCEKENLQCLCTDCHKIKTAQERKERKK